MSSLFIKNMVCDRCKSSVAHLLQEHDLPYHEIRLGEVSLTRPLTAKETKDLSQALNAEGFELLQDRESRLISKIKSAVIRYVQDPETDDHTNLSARLSVHLNKEYSSLSKLFSQVEGRTIENFYIEQRIERVKELLIYDELTLSEIAYQLHYSSVAHLSAQFKKITGMTPTGFKKLGNRGRKPLDKV